MQMQEREGCEGALVKEGKGVRTQECQNLQNKPNLVTKVPVQAD